MGVGTSAGMGIGAAVVADLYFLHERGRMMGIYTVFVTNGAHVAAMIGGPIAKFIGWRACFWIPAIILGAQLVVMAVALPETLYRRRTDGTGLAGGNGNGKVDWLRLMAFRSGQARKGLKLWDFTHVFVMLKYPSVLFPALYYSIHFGLGSVLFAVTGAAAFGGIYHFVSHDTSSSHKIQIDNFSGHSRRWPRHRSIHVYRNSDWRTLGWAGIRSIGLPVCQGPRWGPEGGDQIVCYDTWSYFDTDRCDYRGRLLPIRDSLDGSNHGYLDRCLRSPNRDHKHLRLCDGRELRF